MNTYPVINNPAPAFAYIYVSRKQACANNTQMRAFSLTHYALLACFVTFFLDWWRRRRTIFAK